MRCVAGGHLLCPDPPRSGGFVTCKEITNYRIQEMVASEQGARWGADTADSAQQMLLTGCLLIVPLFTGNYNQSNNSHL